MTRRLDKTEEVVTKGLRTVFAVAIAVFMALFLISGTASAAPQADGGHDKTESSDDNHHPSGKDRTNEPADAEDGEFQGKSKSEPDDDGHGPERDFDEGAGANEDGVEDKPGMEGGMHTDDQDGNNGCGNDDDFEDDNEGWCGKPTAPEESEVGGEEEKREDKTCPEGTTMVNGECTTVFGGNLENDDNDVCVEGSMDDEECDDAEVGGDDETGESGEVAETGDATATGGDAEVLGEVLGRLPVTSADAAGEGEARVLGVQMERAPDAAPAVLGAQFNRTAAAALARTGVGIVTLVALGLGLVTLGAVFSRRRSNA